MPKGPPTLWTEVSDGSQKSSPFGIYTHCPLFPPPTQKSVGGHCAESVGVPIIFHSSWGRRNQSCPAVGGRYGFLPGSRGLALQTRKEGAGWARGVSLTSAWIFWSSLPFSACPGCPCLLQTERIKRLLSIPKTTELTFSQSAAVLPQGLLTGRMLKSMEKVYMPLMRQMRALPQRFNQVVIQRNCEGRLSSTFSSA